MINNGSPLPRTPFWPPAFQTRRFTASPQPLSPWRPTLNPMMGPANFTEVPGMATLLPLDAPVQTPMPNDDIQKKHPGLYARLAKNQIVEDLKPDLVGTGKTLGQVARQRPVKDSQLAELDDNMKRFGSLAIATIATLGLKQRILGVGEYVGFMSWFGAMAATPAVVNSMVRLKTGVNLGQKYDSTYGERLNLFKDPNYLPLHILSQDTMNEAAQRLNIKPGPNQRFETEEKMRQISVQTHTWWMLMAGPATPVISGLVADNLEKPITRLYNMAGRAVNGLRAKSALSTDKLDVLDKRLDGYLDRLIGNLPESELTSWWQDFGQRMSSETGLRFALTRQDVMDKDASLLENKITRYFTNEADANGNKDIGKALSKEKVDRTLAYLDSQFKAVKRMGDDGSEMVLEGKLSNLQTKARDFLKSFEDHYAQELKTASKDQKPALEQRLNLIKEKLAKVDTHIMNASTTVEHYRSVMENTRKTFEKRLTRDGLSASEKRELDAIRAEIKQSLRSSNISDLSYQKLKGNFQLARKMEGNGFVQLESALASGKSKLAHELMGANPQQHLMRVLRDVKAHGLWRNRVVYGIGGTMLAATALYTTLFVGRDFKKTKQPTGSETP